MALTGQKIAVVGGGLGGLCAALCMRARGADVTVYEASRGFGEVGAGIQVSANGLRVLRALGLDPSGAVRSQGLTLNNSRGGRVAILPNTAKREVRLFHRADLLALLADGCRAAGVEIAFSTRLTPDTAPAADLLVAADGVRSAFRSHVAPAHAAPSYAGQTAWRALVTPPNPVGEAGVNVYMGAGQHVVVYPIRGGTRINIVAVDDTGTQTPEGWQNATTRDALVARFAQFGGPVPALLTRAEEVNRWGLFRHTLPHRWSEGRVVLLGDAAHAMLPSLAQGACAAFEDAWELARCWDDFADPDTALGTYERRRAPRVARVMAEAQANATRFHHANAVTRALGHSALKLGSRLAPALFERRYSWLYDFDPTA
ncbi:MAG: FAD-dependent monooxygenase [Pseudomonadota bacterium]